MQQSKLLEANINDGPLEDDADFSLVLGGPLYQLYLKTRMARPALELVRRRIVGIPLICWGPPLVLALFAGREFGGVPVPFLFDLGVHSRFLVALPLLIVAEVIVHERIPSVVRQFLQRGIIAAEDRTRFVELVASVRRIRNSIFIEVLLLVLAFSFHWLRGESLTSGVNTWYAVKIGEEMHFTAAGYWYVLVSLPIFRFILFRWYFRLFVWYWFLWHVRRFPLHPNLFHPDRAGGLGFLAGSVHAFSPLLVAQTIFLAGVMADRIWHAGATLPSFKMEIIGSVAFLMLLVLTPLTFFAGHLTSSGHRAKREFGILTSHYVEDFYHKWIQGDGADGDPLLGTSDIQSLADVGNAYKVVSEMRIVPFGKETVIRLAIIIILPFLPLTLTMIPLDQIIDRLLKLVL
jgi:hypothetical protein